jgi:NACalpha-BTF3-like transcription factor
MRGARLRFPGSEMASANEPGFMAPISMDLEMAGDEQFTMPLSLRSWMDQVISIPLGSYSYSESGNSTGQGSEARQLRDAELVMSQTGVDMAEARRVLAQNDGDIVSAIMQITL